MSLTKRGRKIRDAAVFSALSAVLIALAFVSLWRGNSSANVGFGEMIAGIFTGKNGTVNLFMHSRGPRTAAAMIGGACFALSGLMLQSATGSRLAEASVTGMASSTYLGHFLYATVMPASAAALAFSPLAACVVGGAVTAGVVFLSWKSGLRTNRMLLVGGAVNCMAIMIILTVYLTSGTNASAGLNALVGNLGNQITGEDLIGMAACALAGTGACVFVSPTCNVLALGDKTASGLGVNVTRARFALIALSLFLCSAATFKLGLTSFVGLLCPLVSRKIFGTDHRRLVPACALTGALLVLGCDMLCRLMSTVVAVPVGIITTVAGGTVFLVLLGRSFSGGDK